MKARRLLFVTVLIFLFTLSLSRLSNHAVPLKKGFEAFPVQWQGWQGSSQALDSRSLDLLRLNDYLNIGYRRGGERVGLYVGYYATQTEGGQIHSPKLCLPSSGWQQVSEQRESMDVQGFGKINFVKAVYQKDGQREVFHYWYQMKNACIADEYQLRLYRFFNAVRYGRNDAAFIRFSAPVTVSDGQTSALLNDFQRSILPELRHYLTE